MVINYNLFDPNPFSGVNFYRIKIIEKEKRMVTYSQVMKVNINSGAPLANSLSKSGQWKYHCFTYEQFAERKL